MAGGRVDMRAVTDDDHLAQSGIPHAEVLIAFSEAAVGNDEAELGRARSRLVDSLGPEATVDAAGIVANFQRMVRIADATGIPLDAPLVAITEDLRDEIGVNVFGSAKNTPAAGAAARTVSKLLSPLIFLGIRVAGKLRRS